MWAQHFSADPFTPADFSSANVWTFLCVLAVLLLGTGGLLRQRMRRRHPPEIEPAPVAQAVVDRSEKYLSKRVRELTAELVEAERREQADRARIESFIGELATARAELAAARQEIDRLRGGSDD